MSKIESLQKRLQKSVDLAEKMEEDLDSASWIMQEGILLTYNEAKLIINLIKKSKQTK